MTMPETYPPDKEEIQYKERPLTFADSVGRAVGGVVILVSIFYILMSLFINSAWLIDQSVHFCSDKDVKTSSWKYKCELYE